MHRISLTALVAAIALAYPLAAHAMSYYKIAGNDKGNGLYIDTDSETRIGAYVRMDVFEIKHMSFMEHAVTTRVRRTVEFDCSGRRTRMISSVQYDDAGKQIGSSITFPGFSDDVPGKPNTLSVMAGGDHVLQPPEEDWALDFACGSAQHRDQYTNVGKLP